MRCNNCGYKLSFLMQLYSNIDGEDATLHRMLYLMVCLSPSSIGTQRAVRAYRGYAKDEAFASEYQYSKVERMTDEELVKQGLLD